MRRKNQWLNSNKVWIVNGVINKLDANFKQEFNFIELPGTKLILGNNPSKEIDV
jgi:hypothetical protein